MERAVPTPLDVPTGIVTLPDEIRATSAAPQLLKGMTCIEDLRRAASRRVPRVFFDYAESGSYAEQTLRANRADLERITLKQRVLVDVEQRDTATTIVGEKVSLPIALAPIGLGGMQWADGEILACRAAKAACIPYTMSTMSICSIEDVAQAVGKPFWFQLYVMKDRGFVRSLIERADAARCSALVLTVDLQVLGQRHADVRNGLSVPPALKLRTIVDIASRPAWAARMLSAKRWTFGNLAGHVKGEDSIKAVADWVAHQFDATLSWSDVDWIRSIWPGKLILKGILNVDDARSASRAGADAIVVSNHGGRQLDGAPSTISMLPRIADAVGSDVEMLFDGGVRSGQDLMRALALGARACLVGRAYIYGLGAGGEAGVATAIDILRKELSVTMALTGTTSVAEIDGRVLN
ncbi:MAG: alpha-hydroxy-acid oxidizing protein [Mesorhizobium sp.]|nr:MAG: alpha-hydroxy-acid oxidizing protein [Mesorhizobium sp.]TIQ03567.1 MAG: alpha-hydroxy-acid oxidizing protein [Mesorhizobium sp.]TIR19180.1 MAG: alpha-hydroxy-acid oxidizing protein [Mesorhizobium sp.]